MKVNIGISARHVHLNKEDLEILFGSNYQLEKYKDLTQIGEFAAIEQVTIQTIKNKIDNVRVLGPIRNYTQAEITKTDSYTLGIEPPVRNSGDLSNAASIQIIGPKGSIQKECCIIANRHIHMNEQDLITYGLKPNQIVKVKVDTIKGGIMDNVYIKCDKNFKLEMHIDLDDANSHLLTNQNSGYIIKE